MERDAMTIPARHAPTGRQPRPGVGTGSGPGIIGPRVRPVEGAGGGS
jgi:hypothetical protein